MKNTLTRKVIRRPPAAATPPLKAKTPPPAQTPPLKAKRTQRNGSTVKDAKT